MYFIDPNSLVRATLANQPRTPKARRHHGGVQGTGQVSTSTAVPKTRRHRRLWMLAPFHHAYS